MKTTGILSLSLLLSLFPGCEKNPGPLDNGAGTAGGLGENAVHPGSAASATTSTGGTANGAIAKGGAAMTGGESGTATSWLDGAVDEWCELEAKNCGRDEFCRETTKSLVTTLCPTEQQKVLDCSLKLNASAFECRGGHLDIPEDACVQVRAVRDNCLESMGSGGAGSGHSVEPVDPLLTEACAVLNSACPGYRIRTCYALHNTWFTEACASEASEYYTCAGAATPKDVECSGDIATGQSGLVKASVCERTALQLCLQ